ncbi:beta-glucosidase [Verticillium alfalfae VaMs.102]|uniref:beta-glucosidase n=1 Tax=Verticillium alfalfae (strain VaMs.102 / ATCC MYA-4576 / FGSC 10136) TaxID=526221 RepID=C9SDW1_VERA1|nr:beta-glucosidase [Verticillium alfalfae VaMs.102]EEY16447.1 beta-glucosidase [Verticillium alfalfae VaMs.102]
MSPTSLRARQPALPGTEGFSKGVDVVLGPAIGPLGRLPAGGRNWEGFAVDPYLSGVAVAESVRGIQDAGAIANVKHYIVNEQEHFRQAGEAQGYGYDVDEALSSNVDDKTMHELYLWPFADAINNSYGCQNSHLLNGLLKDELGFQGFVLSDWQAQHAGAATAVAGLDMAMPGDTRFNTGVAFWGANLTNAILNGTVPEYRLDDMAMRIMAAFFKVGKTLDDVPDINFSSWTKDTIGPLHWAAQDNVQVINQHVDVRQDHGALIRTIAARGTVLLKNEGSLPLNKPKFVAVIGEDAGPRAVGPNGCPDQGCNNGTLAAGWGSGTASFPYLITPDSALQFQAISDGSRYESILSNWDYDRTEALVSQADATALVFVNANSGEGYISVDGNEGDRKNLTLWNGGDELIQRVAAANNNTIVIIHSVGSCPSHRLARRTPISRLSSGPGYPDRSLATLLPIFFTAAEPNNGNGAPQSDFDEGVFIDYRWFDRQSGVDNNASAPRNSSSSSNAPIFEFGYGLSYTTFEFSNLQIERHDVQDYVPTTGQTNPAPRFGANYSTNYDDYVFPEGEIRYIYQHIYPYLNSSDPEEALADPNYGQTAEEFLPEGALDASPQPRLPASGGPGGNPMLWDVIFTVTATVTNTGEVAGDEVAQLYVSLGGPDDPIRVLRGFDRINIAPGASQTFRAELTRRDLSNWDVVTQNWFISQIAAAGVVRDIQIEELPAAWRTQEPSEDEGNGQPDHETSDDNEGFPDDGELSDDDTKAELPQKDDRVSSDEDDEDDEDELSSKDAEQKQGSRHLRYMEQRKINQLLAKILRILRNMNNTRPRRSMDDPYHDVNHSRKYSEPADLIPNQDWQCFLALSKAAEVEQDSLSEVYGATYMCLAAAQEETVDSNRPSHGSIVQILRYDLSVLRSIVDVDLEA